MVKNRDKSISQRDVDFVKKYYDENPKPFKSEGKVRARLYRLREKIKATLELLTELAKELPEQQKEQVFTEDSLKHLIEALLTYEPYKENEYVTNPRVFRIVGMLMMRSESKGSNLIKISGLARQSHIEISKLIKVMYLAGYAKRL